MIRSTPRLTVLMMVAMTILGTSGPVAALTQAAKEQEEEEEQQQVQDQQEQGDNPPNPT
ncbi:MAG: hypothetical protein M3382_00490 [Thermoproteota archaeon]|nr:hypothetical protein [Thermoproteota archaeon]